MLARTAWLIAQMTRGRPTPQLERAWVEIGKLAVSIMGWECRLWSGWTEQGCAEGWQPHSVPYMASWHA